jgi:hypothetical protein
MRDEKEHLTGKSGLPANGKSAFFNLESGAVGMIYANPAASKSPFATR